MSALAIHTATPAPAQVSAPSVAAKGEPDAGFAALLGQLNDSKTTAKSEVPASASKSDADPGALGMMQSLEAALANLASLTTPSTAAQAATSTGEGASGATSTPLDTALTAAAGVLEASGWDATGQTPLKTLLQSDPSLGLSDFQIKTFLAAAGATPTRTGATTLNAESAWSPLEAAKSALGAAAPALPTNAAPALPAIAPVAELSTAAAAAQSPTRAATPETPARATQTGSTGHAGASARSTGVRVASTASASASPEVAAAHSAGSASKDAGSGGADSGGAPIAATQAIAADASAATIQTVPLAELPAFIADQAASLTASESDAGAATTTAASAQTPKAAQAVKELHISLDPADLGAMTLKLRLSGGKLSVTIAVANPQTLSSIESDRDLITARLAGGNQSLETLTIQRQGPTAPSTQETSAQNGFANDSFSQSGSSDNEPGASPDSGTRPKTSPRSGAGADGTSGALVV